MAQDGGPMATAPTDAAARPDAPCAWWRRPETLVALTLLVVAFAAFLPTLHADFIAHDDPDYVTENPYVLRGLTWDGVVWAFTTRHAANYHPLTWLSLMLDAQVWGDRPLGFHLTSNLVHAATAALLFLTLRRLTGAMWRPALVALLFAVHPLRVESVAWVAERKDVLSGLLGVAALWAYAGYARSPSWGRYGLVSLLLALGLLAKPMLVTLPFVMLLLDFWPLGRFSRRLGPGANSLPLGAAPQGRPIAEKWPLLAICALQSGATLWAQTQAHAAVSTHYFPLEMRLAHAAGSYFRYLAMTARPVDLSLIYLLPLSVSIPRSVLAGAGLLGISGLAIWQARRRPWLIVGWLWFVGMLVPTIGIIQVGPQALADRYTYLPSIGLLVLIAWSVPSAWVTRPPLRPVTNAAILSVAVVFAVLTWRQCEVWRSSRSVFTQAVRVEPDNVMARIGLGMALFREGRHQEAYGQAIVALDLSPGSFPALYLQGMAAAVLGRPEEGVAALREATMAAPWWDKPRDALGRLLLRLGRLQEARVELEAAVERGRLEPQTRLLLGVTLARLGEVAQALPHLQAAAELAPENLDAQANLGRALLDLGRVEEARGAIDQALAIDSESVGARILMGDAMRARKDWPGAAAAYARAIQLNPEAYDARMGLAEAMVAQGRAAEATRLLEEARPQLPPDPAARMRWERLSDLARQGRNPDGGQGGGAADGVHLPIAPPKAP